MNSEAVEPQHYATKITKPRKDDKIMLKRKLLSVLLALTLVVSMAVPAFAATWEGEYGGIDFSLYINKGVTTASARFTFGANFYVRLYASSIVKPDGENAVVADYAETYGTGVASASLDNGSYGSLPIALVVTNSYAGNDLVFSKTY